MKSARVILLVMFCLVVGFVSKYVYSSIPDEFELGLIGLMLVVIHVVIYFSFKLNWRVVDGGEGRIRVDTLFYVGFYFIYVYPYLLAVLGFADFDSSESVGGMFYWLSTKAVFLSLLFIVFMYIGGDFCFYCAKKNGIRLIADFSCDVIGFVYVSSSAALIFISAYYLFSGGAALFMGAYSGSSLNDVGLDGVFNIIISLAMVSLSCFCYCFFKGFGRPLVNSLLIAPVFILSFGLFVIGDRNSFLLLFVIPVVFYTTFVRRVSVLVWAGGLFAGIFVYEIIEIYRAIGGRGISGLIDVALDYKSSERAIEDSSIFASSAAFRGSLVEISSGQSLFEGHFKLVAFASLIPFLGGFLYPPGSGYRSSAEYLTDLILGPGSLSSVGTNIISDILLDTGVLFLPIFCFIFGFVVIGFHKKLTCRGEYWIVLYPILASSFLQNSRYGFDFSFRVIFIYSLFFLMCKLIKRRSFLFNF